MLKLWLVFWKSEPQYAYKRYAYKKPCIIKDRTMIKSQIQIVQNPYREWK